MHVSSLRPPVSAAVPAPPAPEAREARADCSIDFFEPVTSGAALPVVNAFEPAPQQAERLRAAVLGLNHVLAAKIFDNGLRLVVYMDSNDFDTQRKVFELKQKLNTPSVLVQFEVTGPRDPEKARQAAERVPGVFQAVIEQNGSLTVYLEQDTAQVRQAVEEAVFRAAPGIPVNFVFVGGEPPEHVKAAKRAALAVTGVVRVDIGADHGLTVTIDHDSSEIKREVLLAVRDAADPYHVPVHFKIGDPIDPDEKLRKAKEAADKVPGVLLTDIVGGKLVVYVERDEVKRDVLVAVNRVAPGVEVIFRVTG